MKAIKIPKVKEAKVPESSMVPIVPEGEAPKLRTTLKHNMISRPSFKKY